MDYKRFKTLHIEEVKPTGWLKKQLEIQAGGLSGKLHDSWESVGTYSGWLGGTGENWERGPYYLDGILPLAYYLKDDRLSSRHWNFRSYRKQTRLVASHGHAESTDTIL